MQVINEVFPADPSRMQALLEKGPDGPIFMVNLLKFKDKAEYEDGRETDLSGRDAYMIYGRAVTELLPRFGGQGLFAGDVTFLALGQVEELWDEIAIAMYPDRAAMVRMSLSNEWRQIAVHRAAGLKGQLNIETVTPEGGKDSPFIAMLAGAKGDAS
ncbi:DUF1330 domain-containing protein [Hyphomonas sp.]|uniref:DUF1330 domain-containing protein n=1 Tax=Hyphomonas sp. TaxID=87 RepID=UPI0032EE0FD0|tara:strand:+ start:12657 stop:13127 length:471 start_codon:yes stop_codon:yes gene_type:complete